MVDVAKKPMGQEEVSAAREALEAAFEPHFKCYQLAERWGWSETYIYNLFVNEPGVVKPVPSRGRKTGGKTRTSIRIPLSVAERVYARIINKAS